VPRGVLRADPAARRVSASAGPSRQVSPCLPRARPGCFWIRPGRAYACKPKPDRIRPLTGRP
jgi:hypothetical protein